MRCAILLLALTMSCAALDKVVPVFGDDGEQLGTTTVAEIVADNIDDNAGVISAGVRSVIGGVTGNPIIGGAAGVGILGLLTAGASMMRSRKKADG